MDKLKKLKDILKKMDSVLLAYSGGVDSTLLLKVARDCLQDRVLAVTAVSATYPKEELISAQKIAKTLGVRHKIIKTEELKVGKFLSNPINRCYFCKKELFGRLKSMARKEQLKFVIDATSLSDRSDFRPGNLAKKELKVRSPLAQAGFTKEDIRRWSKKLKLATWDKPSLACLASRIPYGIPVSEELLKRIHCAETYIRRLGIRQVRVRHYRHLCRIEVSKKDIPLLLKKRRHLIDKFKKLGYNYITVDLQGYRTGSLNEVIKQ